MWSNITLQINNRTYTYQRLTPKDQYQMCCKNGLKLPYWSFAKDTSDYTHLSFDGSSDPVPRGAPLCFKVAEDIGGSHISGLQGPFNIIVNGRLTNNSGGTK